MATIKEIAEVAGVSTTTVSNVIHGKTKKVSPATIQKITALIKDMGYVQKMGLRVLNNENSQLIAVVVNYHKDFKNSILGDPFYGQIIGFIEEFAQARGYYLMLYSTKDIEAIFQMVAGWNVDGVIAISFSRRNCQKLYELIKKPIVAIDAYGEAEDDIEAEFDRYFSQHEQDRIVVFTDLMGGSVNQKLMKYRVPDRVTLITGSNLPVLITTMMASDDVTDEELLEYIEESRGELQLVQPEKEAPAAGGEAKQEKKAAANAPAAKEPVDDAIRILNDPRAKNMRILVLTAGRIIFRGCADWSGHRRVS